MEPIPSDAPPPFSAVEWSGDAAPEWIAWTSARRDVEWAIAELAAWAAISRVSSASRGSTAEEV